MLHKNVIQSIIFYFVLFGVCRRILFKAMCESLSFLLNVYTLILLRKTNKQLSPSQTVQFKQLKQEVMGQII